MRARPRAALHRVVVRAPPPRPRASRARGTESWCHFHDRFGTRLATRTQGAPRPSAIPGPVEAAPARARPSRPWPGGDNHRILAGRCGSRILTASRLSSAPPRARGRSTGRRYPGEPDTGPRARSSCATSQREPLLEIAPASIRRRPSSAQHPVSAARRDPSLRARRPSAARRAPPRRTDASGAPSRDHRASAEHEPQLGQSHLDPRLRPGPYSRIPRDST